VTRHASESNRRWTQPIERFSTSVSQWTGSTPAFVASVLVVLGWVVTGPLFGYSNTWQLVINTITNVITFVMVFLIQRAQNKDTLAMQIKLNELVGAVRGSSNEVIAVEDLSEEELRQLHGRYLELARRGERPSPQELERSITGGNRSETRRTSGSG
jgi:low affinity Fe/Cu permease